MKDVESLGSLSAKRISLTDGILVKESRGAAQVICDYLAQLTDHEAIRLYRRLFDPDFGSITDLL